MKRYIRNATINPLDEDLLSKLDIAENTQSEDTIRQLYDFMKNSKGAWDIGGALLNNPKTPRDIIDDMLSTPFYARGYANSGKLPERLQDIAEYFQRDAGIRSSIAQNPNTPQDVLEDYLQNGSKGLQRYVALNPGLSREIIEKLAHSPDDHMRYAISLNPSISPELLTELSLDENDEVRSGVAMNPNTPIDTLFRLTEDDSAGVRVTARGLLVTLGEL